MYPRLIVYHHLGLGDHFICNGLVHALLESTAREIWLPTKANNAQTVKQLYEDYDSVKIIQTSETDHSKEVLGINNLSTQYNVPLLKISFNGDPNRDFDRAFYDQIGMDFDLRWSNFRMPVNELPALEFFKKHIPQDDEPYALVHDTGSVGSFQLDIGTDLKVVKIQPGLTQTLLDWKFVMERAHEIHCIDSSVIHLVDSLNVGASRLVYHDVGRGSRFNLKNNWETKTYS